MTFTLPLIRQIAHPTRVIAFCFRAYHLCGAHFYQLLRYRYTKSEELRVKWRVKISSTNVRNRNAMIQFWPPANAVKCVQEQVSSSDFRASLSHAQISNEQKVFSRVRKLSEVEKASFNLVFAQTRFEIWPFAASGRARIYDGDICFLLEVELSRETCKVYLWKGKWRNKGD